MRDCRKTVQLISPYIYGDLSPREMNRTRRHLSECAHCAGIYEESLRAIGMVPRDLPKPSEEESARLMWAVKGAVGEHKKAAKMLRRRSIALGLTAVGFAAAAVGASLVFYARTQTVIVEQPASLDQPNSPAIVQQVEKIRRQDSPRVSVQEVRPSKPTTTTESPEPPRINFGREVGALMSTTSRAGDNFERPSGEKRPEAVKKPSEHPEVKLETLPEAAVPPVPDTPDNVELVTGPTE